MRESRKPVKVETLALAKSGLSVHFENRFTNGGAMRRVLYRWRKEADGKWVIVSVEDTTGKRSSWSDIPESCGGDRASARGERQCLTWENAAM